MSRHNLRLVAVGAGLALALGIAVRLYGDIDARPRLATADIASIVRDEALALAARDLDEAALQREASALRRDLTARISAYAGAHNLIILSADRGVFGAPDVTAALRALMADGDRR